MAETKLTPRQRRFVAEYLIDANATQAAIRAGYGAKCADVTGPRLLGYVRIRAAIDLAQAERAKRTQVTADKVIAELARIAFADPRRLFAEDGGMKEVRDLDHDTAAALASIEAVEEYEGSGDDRRFVGYTKKVRLWDKVAALEKLGKHLGIFRDEAAVPQPTVIVVSFGKKPDDFPRAIPAAVHGNGTGHG